MNKFYVTLSLLLLSSGIWAQKLKTFTKDRAAFVKDLSDHLKETDVKKEELESFLLEFKTVWESGGIDDKEAAAIYDISNNFLRKRLRGHEPWFYFLGTVMHFESDEKPELLLPWLEDLKKFSKQKPSKLTGDYIRTTYLTFKEYILFDDGRISWKVMSGDYQYNFEGEPYFKFEVADIWGFYKNDSTLIEGTEGIFYPKTFEFKGQGGNVYFTRAGLSEDSAYVQLADYKLNVSKADFSADSVKLNTLLFLNEPLLGSFQEKLTSQGGRNGTFPRFSSYRKDITIKQIVPGADYTGGFSMIGSKFYGGGTDGSKAMLRFSYDGRPMIQAAAERFLLRLDKVESQETEVSIYLGEDSIYHPKVTLRFIPESKQLTIIREDQGLGQTPFSDGFHKMDITFEILNWKIDEPLMRMGNMNMGAESPVVFESKQYFRGQRFSALSGLATRSPLYELRALAMSYRSDEEVGVQAIANYLRMDVQDAHIYMMNMSIHGFVKYDLQKREAVFQDKIFEYIENNEKKRDYDVIRFVSNLSQGSNAQLSLLNNDLEITGVSAVALSDSQKVGLFPRDRKIVVHENLNFDFDGRITAGRFTYWGELFKFNYEQFRINMENIDSMRFKVESFKPNALGQRELKNVKTVLQGLTGELLIDDPGNKSGQKRYTEYPIFRSAKDSYVYYDKRSIFNGVYNREEFFVTLDPFEIDSLDNVTTQGLKFEGDFTSAGIFPDMRQTLTVQSDYSLGFTTETPAEGLSAYGKGRFTSTIRLSNEGLRGDGRIDYLNSVATSDEFFFFPDSANGAAANYEIEESTAGTENPHVVGLDIRLHWEPKNDVMYTTSKQNRFDMYDDIEMKGTGTLAHSPSALKGRGLMEFLDAETRSKNYLFENRKFSSPKLGFKVRADTSKEWGFEMTNATGLVDFDKEKGDFRLNDPGGYFSFPDNQYICYMDYAKWMIPEKAINVQKKEGNAASKMVSVHPRQDSLQFLAGYTKFYLENSLLESFKVPNIKVADASIFPDTGYVAIEANAHMRTLNNAAITANRESKYHEFYGSVIDIYSRNKYEGTGDYEYVDQDGTPWPINFESIKVDTSLTTVGYAMVKQEEGFYMSPYFAYFGKVKLRADRKALEFDGSTHIFTTCPSISTDWFAFKSIVDPSNIIIDLPEIDPNDKSKTLANGIYLAADTVGGYAAFLSKNVRPGDKQMFFANGKLYFDESTSSYVITSAEKLEDPESKGNILSFNSNTCIMHGDGVMSLGDGRSQMNMRSWGTIDYDLNNDNMVMDMVLTLDFFFSDDILKQTAVRINEETLLEGTDLGRTAFLTALNEELKPKARKSFNQDVADYGAPGEFPKELQGTIMFSDIKLKWTPEAVSFLSEGKVGIGALGDNTVNKKMTGYMEIQRKKRGDEIYIYIEPDRSTQFYIEYKRNMLSLYTNEAAIMDIIKEIDLNKRRNEAKGLPPFTYTIGTKGKMNRFLQHMEKYE